MDLYILLQFDIKWLKDIQFQVCQAVLVSVLWSVILSLHLTLIADCDHVSSVQSPHLGQSLYWPGTDIALNIDRPVNTILTLGPIGEILATN